MSKSAYIIFSKIPEPGYVKTRLSPDFTSTEASNIQNIMLKKLLKMSKELSKTMRVFFCYYGHDKGKEKIFLNNLPSYITPFQQCEGSLGLKMSRAINDVKKMGYQNVILTGSDIPQINKKTILDTAKALDKNDIAIGPTYDGGYYLFGISNGIPDPYLNVDISWSTSSVLDTTIELINKEEKKLYFAPTLVDVDFKKDIDLVSEYIEG